MIAAGAGIMAAARRNAEDFEEGYGGTSS
jgi:hypothetical protein